MENQFRGLGLVFWVQRQRYWNPRRLGRLLASLEPLPSEERTRALEGGTRSLLFRLR